MKLPGEPRNFLITLALSIIQIFFLFYISIFLSSLALSLIVAASSVILLYSGGDMFYESIAVIEKRFLKNPQGAMVVLLSMASIIDEIFLIGVATFDGLGSVDLGAIIGSNVFVTGIYLAYLLIKGKRHHAFNLELAVIILGTGLLLLSGVFFNMIIVEIAALLLLVFMLFLFGFRRGVLETPENNSAAEPQAFFILLGLAGIGLAAYNIIHATEAVSGFLGISSFTASFVILGAAASLPEDYLIWLALTRKRTGVAYGIVMQSTIYKEMLLLPLASIALVIYTGTDAMVSLAVLLGLMLALIPLGNGEKM